jgi:hypothetical protein
MSTAKVGLTLCVLVLCSQAAMAGPLKPASQPEKRPWQLTVEERLSLRLDPALISQRQLEGEQRDRAMGKNPDSAVREGPKNHSVNGAVSPELLFPHEMFDSLMAGLVPDETRRFRNRRNLAAGIRSQGLDPDNFWAQLETVVDEYARYKYRGQLGMATTRNEDPQHRCRLAFQALTSAREAFGAERFDRLLYEVIAPVTQVASATTGDPADELRRAAGGCK